MSPRARMLSRATRKRKKERERNLPCAESTRRGPLPRVSRRLYRPYPSELCAPHTPLSTPGAPRARFSFVRRASCRETVETMVVFAAKLKPPTDFSYFADERRRRRRPGLRSWLSCAKSPLGVFRFISACRRVCIKRELCTRTM